MFSDLQALGKPVVLNHILCFSYTCECTLKIPQKLEFPTIYENFFAWEVMPAFQNFHPKYISFNFAFTVYILHKVYIIDELR